ncbi:MAG: phosphoribosylformylglycinamidine cyclo-ligase [Candidatus Micrarchaeota archaeon]|nr:phosphoribosylformylglycinamidine cyclo-ligase [Candidatus Micrarchaeota archaeon]
MDYARAGVNVKKVRAIHNLVGRMLFAKQPSFVLPIKDHYAGLFRVGGKTLAIHCDGVGSKVLVAQQLSKYDTVGIDCVAMNVNDIICIGARPLVLVDYLALAEEDRRLVVEIMKGLRKGAQEAGCALVGGETAILPEIISGAAKPFDLAATCVGVVEGRLITGKDMKVGDVVIGLESSGLHSNGYTLARKVLEQRWWKEMLTPTRIYVKPVLEMLENCKVAGLAHITGGAFSKLARIGKHAKAGFLLDGMPQTNGVMAELEEKVGDPYEFYRTFNGGIGMCVICPKQEAEEVLSISKKYKIKAYEIGKVIRKQDVLLQKGGKRISLL